jgi:hypothetical protein
LAAVASAQNLAPVAVAAVSEAADETKKTPLTSPTDSLLAAMTTTPTLLPRFPAGLSSCSVDLGAAYVHGCNESNSVWRLAQCTNQPLDVRRGGYSVAWGERCLWRSRDGRVLGKSTLKRAFLVSFVKGGK